MTEPIINNHIERLIKRFIKVGFTDLQAKVLAMYLSNVVFDERHLDEAIENYLKKREVNNE